jgi:hypothetical protein
VDLLETLLGIVILASGAILIVRPHPRKQVSGNAAHLLAGGVGGLLNGMLQTLCYSLDRQLPAPAGQQPVNRRIPDSPERSTSDLQESVARPVAFSSGTLPAKERYDCRDAEPSNAISQ